MRCDLGIVNDCIQDTNNNNNNVRKRSLSKNKKETFSKFVTYVTEVKVENESEEENNELKNNSSEHSNTLVYSDGYIFFYSLHAKNSNISHAVINQNAECREFYIEPLMASIKEEILQNKVCRIDMEAWVETVNKADIFLKTKHVQNIRLRNDMSFISFNFHDFVEPMDDNGGLTNQHIFAVLFSISFLCLRNS